MKGLYFDGRQDEILNQDVFTCMSHIKPTSGIGHSIFEVIRDFLLEENIDTSELVIIGCDGKAINKGQMNGAMAYRKASLKVCLFFLTNELSFGTSLKKLTEKGLFIIARPNGMALKKLQE